MPPSTSSLGVTNAAILEATFALWTALVLYTVPVNIPGAQKPSNGGWCALSLFIQLH